MLFTSSRTHCTFNDAACSSDYIAPNYGMINEQRIDKHMEGFVNSVLLVSLTALYAETSQYSSI
jgi:hypothetical protein